MGFHESVTGGRGSSYHTPLVGYRKPGVSGLTVEGLKPRGGMGCAPVKPGTDSKTFVDGIAWAAVRSKYFVAAVVPDGDLAEVTVRRGAGRRQDAVISLPTEAVRPGRSLSSGVTLYIGPQARELLKEAPGGLSAMLDMGVLGPVARVLHLALKYIQTHVRSHGWSILLLSLGIKLVLFPFTRKSYDSMKKWQQDVKAIQPKLDAIKEKFKNNPQKINKETMALYKREGMNPLSGCKGGCLPMLFQMPVFFSLYRVLGAAIELRNANFLWIPDLSTSDPLKILPILMGISMFWQQKLTGMGAGASGTQQEQQKMMTWMMPIMMAWIFMSLPAGLVLYWLGFNVFTSLQQLIKRPAH